MALTKAQKAALKGEGLNAAALKKLEAILDADAEGDDNGDKPPSSKRVVVYEGADADSFMAKMFGSTDDADDDADDDDDDDDDEPEGDDKPPGKTRWFG